MLVSLALLTSATCLLQDNDLRQAAVYGLGVAAQIRQEAFRPVASQARPHTALCCLFAHTVWLVSEIVSGMTVHPFDV